MNSAAPLNYFAIPGFKGVKRTLNEVVYLLLEELGISSIEELQVKSRKREIVSKRQIIMYMLKWHGGFTLAQIGLIFKKDHATVLHSERAVENDMILDRDLRKEIDRLKSCLKSTSLRIGGRA